MKAPRQVLAAILVFWSATLFGGEFAPDRERLAEDLSQNGQSTRNVRLAIYFITEDREKLSKMTDLVSLKKSIARELLESFTVTDPTVVHEVISKKNVDPAGLEGNPGTVAELSKIFDSTHLTLAKLSEGGADSIKIRYRTLNRKAEPVSSFATIHPTNNRGNNVLSSALSKFSEPKKQVAQSGEFFETETFTPSFSSSSYPDDTFGYFTPNAYLTRETFYLETSLWISNIAEVSIFPKYVRFAYHHKIFQIDLESRGSDDAYHHSSYLRGRLNLVDPNKIDFPLSLSLGLRGRLFWNDLNRDYVLSSDPSITESNENLDRLTLFASTAFDIPRANTTLNLYLDNLRTTFRGLYRIGKGFNVSGDVIFFFYEGDAKHEDQTVRYSEPDLAIAGGYSGADGFSFGLAFQNRTKQLIFSLKAEF